MALDNSQSPNDPNSEVSIDDDFLKLIADTVRRAYGIYNHRPNRDDMEDIAQSVALSLIKNDSHGLCSFEHWSKLETWLQVIVNHEVIRFFRRQKDEVDVEDLPPGDLAYQPILEYKVLRDEIVGKLTDDEWELFELLEQGLKPKEIAERLGIKPAYVYVLIHRLRKKIEKLLESKGGNGTSILGGSGEIDSWEVGRQPSEIVSPGIPNRMESSLSNDSRRAKKIIFGWV